MHEDENCTTCSHYIYVKQFKFGMYNERKMMMKRPVDEDLSQHTGTSPLSTQVTPIDEDLSQHTGTSPLSTQVTPVDEDLSQHTGTSPLSTQVTPVEEDVFQRSIASPLSKPSPLSKREEKMFTSLLKRKLFSSENRVVTCKTGGQVSDYHNTSCID